MSLKTGTIGMNPIESDVKETIAYVTRGHGPDPCRQHLWGRLIGLKWFLPELPSDAAPTHGRKPRRGRMGWLD
jgi:hypothetical protein